jgi:hypothetical protein
MIDRTIIAVVLVASAGRVSRFQTAAAAADPTWQLLLKQFARKPTVPELH